MNLLSDKQLLTNYATHHDDASFAEIVKRYRDLVYSAALRQVSPTDAAEVAQSVFIDLAGKADTVAAWLSGESSLAGWLHRATRFSALNHLRAAHRRVANETQAMQELRDHHNDDTDWAHIQPVLDEAIDSLEDADREAVLLRFFKNLDFRTVGGELGVSDDAAQKRVSRALERLRGFFARRGITVSVSALAAVLSSKAVQAAPVGFAVTLAAGAKSAVTVAQTVTTTKQIIAMTTLQKGLIAASVAVATVVGVTVYQKSKTPAVASEQVAQTAEPAPETKTETSATDQVRRLNAQIDSLASALEKARKSNEQTIAERDEALRAAAIYKELAKRKESDVGGEAPLPTHRHYMQGIGQIAANLALLKATDSSKLSPEEKRALEDEKMKLNIEVLKLVRSAKAKGYDDPEGEANVDQPDNTACFLHGALSLNQDQFTRIFSLINQFNTPSLPVVPKTDPITAERMVVVKQRRAELDRQIEPVLTSDQLVTFKAIQSSLHIIDPYDGSVTLGYTWPRQ